MRSILGEFKKYNANSRNHRTGDCVVRAISLATKFPDWIVPLVLEAVDNNGNLYTDRYEVFT